jgi:hypothetical protein
MAEICSFMEVIRSISIVFGSGGVVMVVRVDIM